MVEAFDLPDDLGVTPAGVFLATGDAGGPFTPAGNTYTLSNNGAASLNWTAADNAVWLDLSAASGSLGAGATVTVTATLNAAAASLADGLYSAAITFTNTVSGATLARTVYLRIGQVDYFTEIFDTSAHDIGQPELPLHSQHDGQRLLAAAGGGDGPLHRSHGRHVSVDER